MRCKGKPCADLYAHKIAILHDLETLSASGAIDLFYADETHISSEGYVPYGWQFPGETVAIYVEKGYKINLLGLISRQNQCHFKTTEASITSSFVCEFLDDLSLKMTKETVVVLDNASIHRAKIIQERKSIWEQRGLFLVTLPPYSPHLNIAETLWRKIKAEWLVPEDYLDKDTLFYAVNRCMASIGKELTINFKKFTLN